MAFRDVETVAATDTLPAGFNKINLNFDDIEATTTGNGAGLIGLYNGDITNIVATNVHDAIQELDNEKASTSVLSGTGGAATIGITAVGGFTGDLQDVVDDLAEATSIIANGAQKIGFDDTGTNKYDAATVGNALLELTYTTTGNGATIIGVEADTGFTANTVQGALEELLVGTSSAYSDSIKLEFNPIAGISSVLPTNSGSVRVHALDDCFIEFGDSSVSIGVDSIYMAGGSEVFGLPSGATHIAVKGAGSLGAITVTGLEGVYKYELTTNTVIVVQGGSSNVELPAGNNVRLFSMTDCYIAFGDASIVATDSDMFFEAGTEVVQVPSTATHIAAVRYALNGGLYITGIN